MITKTTKKKYFLLVTWGFYFLFLNNVIYAESLSKGTETVRILNDNDTVSELKKAKSYHAKGNSKYEEKNDYNDIPGNKYTGEDIVEIIVEDKEPLKLPEAFISALKEKGITGITLGDINGNIRLLSVNGDYINPCITKSQAKISKSAYHGSSRPCRFEAGLGETHMIIASRNLESNDCSTCQGEGITRSCKVSLNKWKCKTRNPNDRKPCDAPSVCGDDD